MSGQAMTSATMKPPVFIHSLFRAGSTYLFNAFRRSEAGYWCYQEPLHEISLFAQSNKESLLDYGGEKMALLRHPKMKAPYFLELYDVADQCLPTLKKSAIYDCYFASPDEEFEGEYWQSLIQAARGRPVIQECRTSSRIGAMRKLLGGFHLYLWRNPWDQWWSYKVDEYFCAANLLIINAAKHPAVIERLRREIGFSECNDNDVAAQFEWFKNHPLTPEHTYLVFYILWYLGLREGVTHAHLLLNIDRLADSPEYRSEVVAVMSRNGIEGIDFSDCVTPQAQYGEGDREFFRDVEKQAHGLLLLSGVPQREIDHMMAVRREYEPKTWVDVGDRLDQAGLIRDAERARALVRKVENREVALRSTFSHQLQTQQQRAKVAESRASEQEQRAKAAQFRASAQQQRAKAAELRASGQQQRAKAAESLAAEQEQRAKAAESLAAEQEQRAKAAESLAAEQEQRAKAAESLAAEQEQRAKAAESLAAEQERRAEAAECLAAAQAQRAKAAAEHSGHGAESLGGEQERKAGFAEGFISEQQRRIDELVAESDYWRLHANWVETERNALRQSWSWRMTAPERYLISLVTHGTTAIHRRANQFVRPALTIFQRRLVAGIRVVLQKPPLSRFINQRLTLYPALYRYLLRVARRGGVIPGPSTDVELTSSASHFDPPELAALSPRVRKIYNDLKDAIQTQRDGKG